MAWRIDFHRDDQHHENWVPTFDMALALARQLIGYGVTIEKVESETGFSIPGEQVKWLCER